MKDPIHLERYQTYTAVFGTSQGKWVLADIMKICGYEQSSLNRSTADGRMDPFFMAAREGKRSVAIDIKDNLKEPLDMPTEGADEG